MEQDWYFTFGSGQEHENCYAVFYGTYNSARNQIVDKYGQKWSFQYPSAEEAGVERWWYRRV